MGLREKFFLPGDYPTVNKLQSSSSILTRSKTGKNMIYSVVKQKFQELSEVTS